MRSTFPARIDKIRKFGHLDRRVRRIGPPPPLQKSFVEVVTGMGDRKRGLEDKWMEEDDLLGQEYKELDPRSKIQRNFSNKHGAYGDRSRFRKEGNRFGGHGGRFNEAYQHRGETRGLIPRDNN